MCTSMSGPSLKCYTGLLLVPRASDTGFSFWSTLGLTTSECLITLKQPVFPLYPSTFPSQIQLFFLMALENLFCWIMPCVGNAFDSHIASHLPCCCCCSVTKLCLTLCNPMSAARQASLSITSSGSWLTSIEAVMPSNHLRELTHVHWGCHPTISSSIVPFSSRLQSFPASGSFPMSWPFPSGGRSIGAAASASVLPMNIQGYFPLGLTGLVSLQSKGLSRLFSNTTIQKHQFSGAHSSLWSNPHIHSTHLIQEN